jgi:hypothetical protein
MARHGSIGLATTIAVAFGFCTIAEAPPLANDACRIVLTMSQRR